MLNPNFIIFIQLSHYCLTSEIIFVPVYGCELFTIPDLICTVTLLTTYCSRNHVKTIYRSIVEFNSLMLTKIYIMCQYYSTSVIGIRTHTVGTCRVVLTALYATGQDCTGGTYLHNHS